MQSHFKDEELWFCNDHLYGLGIKNQPAVVHMSSQEPYLYSSDSLLRCRSDPDMRLRLDHVGLTCSRFLQKKNIEAMPLRLFAQKPRDNVTPFGVQCIDIEGANSQ